MRNSLSNSFLCRVLPALLLLGGTWAETGSAQQTSGRRVAQETEQDARASWQPVRDLSTRTAPGRPAPASIRPAAAPVQQVDYRSSDPAKPTVYGQRASVRPNAPTVRGRLVNQSGVGTLPTPAPSVMESVPTPNGVAPLRSSSSYQPSMNSSMPLEGQIIYDSAPGEVVYDDGAGYGHGHGHGDGSCGCGDLGCDGMCDGSCQLGCDGGCGGSCGIGGCNGNPMCGQYNDCDALQPCVTVCLPQDGWLSAEYLMWWQKGVDTPPLASTDRLPSATQPTNPGQLLFGGEEMLTDQFDGLRIGFGFWLDRCHTWGIGAEYFQIGEETDSFNGNPTNFPLLGRPFLNTAQNGREDIELVNGPSGQAATITGNLDIDVTSELSGWGIHLRHLRCVNEGCTMVCGCPERFCSRTEFLIGFRQVELREDILMREALTETTAPNTRFNIFDRFDTRNQFNGIDFGWAYQRVRGYWIADAGIRLGVGSTRQTVRIDGQTIIDNEAPQLGGLLAQRSNIGTYEQNEFAVMPQLDLKLGYQLTDQLRATVGYTFLYWSNVVRPGDQIDRFVDPAQLASSPPPTTPVAAAFPAFDFDTTDYWAQGISFGAEYRW